MSALRDWFRRRPSSSEISQPYHNPVVTDQHAPPEQQQLSGPQEASWIHWGYPMPTQFTSPPTQGHTHGPIPSFDTVRPCSRCCMHEVLSLASVQRECVI